MRGNRETDPLPAGGAPAAPKAAPAPPAPSAPPAAPTAAAAARAAGPARLPAGGQVYVTSTGNTYVVYDIGDGIKVAYGIFDPSVIGGLPVNHIDIHDWDAMHLVDAGSAAELSGITEPTYQAWFDRQLQMWTGGAQWVNDPEIRRIYAGAVVNETSPAEVLAQIHQTNYWKSRSDAQRNYLDKSPAEQAQQDAQAAADLAGAYWGTVGTQISLTDPQLQDWAHQVASGAMSANQVVEQFFKPLALRDAESPWSRTIRNEEQLRHSHGIDVENQAGAVRDLYERWGLPSDPNTIKQWATDIVDKTRSESDLLKTLQDQARVLYPWKDPTVETKTAAEPWMATYARVLERPAAGIFDADIQKALNAGVPPYEFARQLKDKPEWLNTDNAKQDLMSAAGQAARTMGF